MSTGDGARATVVITTKNRLTLLREAVESVRRQSVETDLVVVDDGSTDFTPNWLDSVEDVRTRVIRLDTSRERGAARNIGLRAAKAPYVLFLDDDDRLRPRALSTLAAALERAPTAIGAIGARVSFDPTGQRRRLPHAHLTAMRTLHEELFAGWITSWIAVPGQCLFRTDVLRTAGGWREDIIGPEDQELLLRLSDKGPFALTPSVVLDYRLHPGQWRAADVAEVEQMIREEAFQRLPESAQAKLRPALDAGPALREATIAYNDGRYAQSVQLLLAAGRRAPFLYRSPLLGPALVQLTAKSIVGSLLGPLGGRARLLGRRLRRSVGRAPTSTVDRISDSAKRNDPTLG